MDRGPGYSDSGAPTLIIMSAVRKTDTVYENGIEIFRN